MSRKTDFIHLQCDRCGKEQYLIDSDPQINNWTIIKRYTATQIPTTNDFCYDCMIAWKKLAQKHDTEFTLFKSNILDASTKEEK